MENIEKEAVRLIQLKMKEKGWNSSEMARKLNIHQTSVIKMLQSDRIKLNRIQEISDLLGYNFLRVLADRSNLTDPPKYTAEDATRERIRELEIENATLLKVLRK